VRYATHPAPGRTESWPSAASDLRDRYRTLVGKTIVGVVVQAQHCVFSVSFYEKECLSWELTQPR
jgi:hypothetical protein